MTGAVKTNGIWAERPDVRNPVDRLKIPTSELEFIYYDLVASENATTRVGVFLDSTTVAADEYSINTHVFERYGKSVTRSFLFPELSKTPGIHNIIIKTGTKKGTDATVWKWTSKVFEVIFPISGPQEDGE
jgi:hypothetical protein